MQRSGIVMKLGDSTAVLMTQSGEFLKVKRQPFMEVGMEVPVTASTVSSRHRRAPVWQRVGAAAIAACLVLGGGTWYELGHASKAYAFVSVDINPSLAFTVDRNEQVLAVTGLNPDGKHLVAQLQVVHKPLQVAIRDTVNEAAADQLMAADDTILVTAAPANAGQDVSTLATAVRAEVQTAISQSPKVKTLKPSVYTLQVSNTVWKAATQKHISPGKLYTYILAHEEGHQLPLDRIQGAEVGNIIKSSGQVGKALEQALKSGDPKEIRSVIQGLSPINSAAGVPAPANSVVPGPANTVTGGQNSVGAGQATPPGHSSESSPKPGKHNGHGRNSHNPSTPNQSGTSGLPAGVTITIDGAKIHVTMSVPQPETGSGSPVGTTVPGTSNQTTDSSSGQYHAPNDGMNAPELGAGTGSTILPLH